MILEAAGHSLSESRVRANWSLLRMDLQPSAQTPESLQRISEANLKHGRCSSFLYRIFVS